VTSRPPNLRTLTRWQTAGLIACALYPAVHGVYWAVPLTGAAVAGAMGVWRLVRLEYAALSMVRPPSSGDRPC
jgi:hypothetical protein